jgi:hypothetical protein
LSPQCARFFLSNSLLGPSAEQVSPKKSTLARLREGFFFRFVAVPQERKLKDRCCRLLVAKWVVSVPSDFVKLKFNAELLSKLECLQLGHDCTIALLPVLCASGNGAACIVVTVTLLPVPRCCEHLTEPHKRWLDAWQAWLRVQSFLLSCLLPSFISSAMSSFIPPFIDSLFILYLFIRSFVRFQVHSVDSLVQLAIVRFQVHSFDSLVQSASQSS